MAFAAAATIIANQETRCHETASGRVSETPTQPVRRGTSATSSQKARIFLLRIINTVIRGDYDRPEPAGEIIV
jgi:hypothetical protein